MNDMAQEQEIEAEVSDDVQSDEEQHTPTEAEQRATEQGWTPEDRWNGDPDKWVGAEEFLERGEKHNGILRERNEKLISEVHALKTELRDSVRQFGESTRKAEERALQRAMKELKLQQRAAVEQGDAQTWETLEEEKTSLQDEFVKANEKPKEQTSPDQDPAYLNWHSRNQWYNEDLDMTVYANQIAPIVAGKLGNSNTPEFYDEIAKQVKKKYPNNFRNTNRDMPSPVQGTKQEGGKPGKKGKSYNDLPEDAKKACDKFTSQKLMTQEEYIAEYFKD